MFHGTREHKVKLILDSISQLETDGDERLERAKERASSWLKDFTERPLTAEESKKWQKIVDETVEAELDGGAEDYVSMTMEETSSISDKRQEIEDWDEITNA